MVSTAASTASSTAVCCNRSLIAYPDMPSSGNTASATPCAWQDPPGLGAFIGHVHASILRALGCVAYATNGSVRDLPSVRKIGFQFFAKTVSISHAFVHLIDFAQPVTVGGLRVESGDIVYGDGHGLLTIPPAIVDDIPLVAARMLAREQPVVELCQSPDFSLERLQTLLRPLG